MLYHVFWVLVMRALLYANVAYVFLAFEAIVLVLNAVVLAQRKRVDQA